MRWRVSGSIGWPPDDVVVVARDRLARLAAYLPEVDAVEALGRIEADGVMTSSHRWRLERTAFPAVVASWVPEDALGFTASTRWAADRATFEVAPLIHPDLVHLGGELVLHDDGGATLAEVEGVFTLSPRAAHHLPAALRDRGISAIEAGIATAIRSRVTQALAAIEAVLDDAW